MPHIRTAAAALVAALALPAAASAHVTLQPNTAPANGFTRLDVRVPTERDDAATVKVDVQLPPGFAFVSYEPRPGWKVAVKRGKAEQPIEVEGGFEVDEEVRQITWSAAASSPASSSTSGSRCACRTAKRATSSPSRRSRPTTTARSSAGSAPRTPTSPLRS